MSRAAAVVIAAAAVSLSLPALAQAHPHLVTSTPSAGQVLVSPPATIDLRLSEPVDPVDEGIEVTGPTGRDVTTGPTRHAGRTLTRPIDASERGTYVVEWLVVGDDSHPARGAFLFSVGEETRVSLPGGSRFGTGLQSFARWLSLFGFALGFGVPFAAAVSGGMTPRLWRLVSGGIVLMIVAEPVALLGQTATLAPARAFDPVLARAVLLTSYGHVTALLLGAALALWALAGALRQAGPQLPWAIPALGAGVALVHATAAHRIGGIPWAFSFLLAAGHVAAFGAWLGCVLVALAEERWKALARTAVLAAVFLSLGGAALAFGHLNGPADLVETAYGSTLLVKISLVAIAFSLGAAARRRGELAAALAALAAASLLASLLPPV